MTISKCPKCGGFLTSTAAHRCPGPRPAPAGVDAMPPLPPPSPYWIERQPVALTACYDPDTQHTWLYQLYADGTVYAHCRGNDAFGWVSIAPPTRTATPATEAADG